MTILQQVVASQGADVVVTENFRAVAPAGLYGINPVTTTLLTLGLYGGQFNGNTVADGTVALTASATNYVVADRTTGAVTASTGTTNWLDTADYMQLYELVAGTTTFTIAATSDKRQTYGGTGGTGGGGTTTSADVAVVAGAVDLDPGGDVPRVLLDSNVTAITLPATPAAGTALPLLVLFVQDGTGGWTVTGWPGGVTWEGGGGAPTIDATPGAITTVPLLLLDDGTILGTP